MIDWWRKIICFAVANHTFSMIKTSNHHTFSRILLPKSYTFSRITPCTLCWIQKVRPQKSIIHPSNIQQKTLSLLTTKSAKGLHTREANLGLWIHQKHEKATGIASSFKPNQNLNHYSTTNSAPKPGQGPHGHNTWTIGLQSVDIQQPSETASENDKQLKTSYNKYQQAVKALILSAFYCIYLFPKYNWWITFQ